MVLQGRIENLLKIAKKQGFSRFIAAIRTLIFCRFFQFELDIVKFLRALQFFIHWNYE